MPVFIQAHALHHCLSGHQLGVRKDIKGGVLTNSKTLGKQWQAKPQVAQVRGVSWGRRCEESLSLELVK